MKLDGKLERKITFLTLGERPSSPYTYWSTRPYADRLVEVFTIVSAGKEIPFLSKEHFIQNKQAIGRPQDLADIDHIQNLGNL